VGEFQFYFKFNYCFGRAKNNNDKLAAPLNSFCALSTSRSSWPLSLSLLLGRNFSQLALNEWTARKLHQRASKWGPSGDCLSSLARAGAHSARKKEQQNCAGKAAAFYVGMDCACVRASLGRLPLCWPAARGAQEGAQRRQQLIIIVPRRSPVNWSSSSSASA